MNNTDSNRQGIYLQSQFSHQLLGSFENSISNSLHIKEPSNPNVQELKSEVHYSPEFSTDYLPISSELYQTNFLTNTYENQQFVNSPSLNYFNSNKKLCGFLSSTMNNFTELDRIDYSRINEINNFDQYYQPYQNLKNDQRDNTLNHFTSLSRQIDLAKAESNTISQYIQSSQPFSQISNVIETHSTISTNSPICYENNEMKPNELTTNHEAKRPEKNDDYSNRMRSINIEEDLQTNSDFSSHSSSIVSINIDFVKYNDKSIEILIPKGNDCDNIISNKIEFAETLSNHRSSTSDIDSLDNFIDEDSIEHSNVAHISSKTNESDLQVTEPVLETVPDPAFLATECRKYFNDGKEDSKNNFISEFLTSVNIEKIVEIILNMIIQSEVEKLKPVFVKGEKDCAKTLVPLPVSDYQFTSLIDEVVDQLSNIGIEDINPNNVLKSEDVWELSDLTLEDPWKIECPILIISNDIEDINKEPFINSLDNELREKVSWLIPLRSEFIDPLTDSAISYFYECRKNHLDFATYPFVSTETPLPINHSYNPTYNPPCQKHSMYFNNVDEIKTPTLTTLVLERKEVIHVIHGPSYPQSLQYLKNYLITLTAEVDLSDSLDERK